VIEGRAESLEEVAIDTGVAGVRIVSGSCDVLGAADLSADHKRRLLGAIKALHADVLLIDVGAGTAVHTVDLFNAADTRLVVMTPELTSAQNAYGFLKVAVYRRLQRALEGLPVKSRLEERIGADAFRIGSTMQKVDTFLSLVAEECPELESAFQMLLREMNVKLIGNMFGAEADRNTIWAIKRMMTGFLGIDAEVAAAFRANQRVRRCINAGQPLAVSGTGDYDVAEFARLATSVLGQDMRSLRSLRESISAALAGEGKTYAFGLDGVEIVELEEITDPEELARIHRADAADVESLPEPPDVEVEIDLVVEEPDELSAQRFVSQLDRLKRRSTRGNVHVEVQMFGQWFFGKLIEVTDRDAIVEGVHPFGSMDGRPCGLRFVELRHEDEPLAPSEAAMGWQRYEEDTGRAVLRFSEPAAATAYAQHFARHRATAAAA
jgi:flagellar biosynthesis protein FlhG